MKVVNSLVCLQHHYDVLYIFATELEFSQLFFLFDPFHSDV
jgi:hypothetical protein